MSRNHSIISYCSIRNNSVLINDELSFTGSNTGFKVFSAAIYKRFGIEYPKFYKMDNLCKLGFLATELLMREKEIRSRYTGNETGLIFMNSSSSLDTDQIHQDTILDRTEYFPSPSVFVYTLPNIVIGEICIRNKITGESTFFIQEKFNPSFLVSYVDYLFDCEIINRCIAGWIEVYRDDYESVVCLIEKTAEPNSGFVNFDPAVIRDIYNKNK